MLQEIRHALRLLARNPVFTLIAALSLALGIGANSAMFSMADALFLRPLPIRDPGRVVVIAADTSEGGGDHSFPDYRDLRDKSRSFAGMVASDITMVGVARSDKEVPQMRAGMLVTDNFFSVLGVQPALGRGFLPEEGQTPGRDAVAVLSHDFWRSEFASDPSAVGRTLRINGIDFTVVGVAPERFTGVDQFLQPALYLPVMMMNRLSGQTANPLETRGDHQFVVRGRLKPGVSLPQAQAELAGIFSSIKQQYPEADRDRTLAVRTELQDRYRQDTADAQLTAMLLALAGLVLLIACANVANLLLGRARARTREVAIRLALGISAFRLMRQLLLESLMLSLVGCAAGLGLAYGGIRFLQTIQIPTDLPIVIHPVLDGRVLLYSVVSAVISAVVFGLAPAWKSLKLELVPALKNAESGLATRHRTWGRNVLVVAQVAMSMMLLIATGMLLAGMRNLLLSSPGFRVDHLLMTGFNTSMVRYSPAQTHDFYRDLRQRVGGLPGVRGVALTSSVPFSANQSMFDAVPDGYQFPKGQQTLHTLGAVVDENFFQVLDVPLVSGRAFTADDKEGSQPVAIVNQRFAQKYWPNQDPIGKRLQVRDGDKNQWRVVVGVTRTGKYIFPTESPQSYVYLPFAQNQKTSMTLLTESSADAAGLAGPVREVVHALDTNQPVFNMRTVSNLYHIRAISTPMMIMEVVAAMGCMGLTLAVIGLYGLVSYSVARRTREIGVRMAIGARQADVLGMVLKQGFILAGAGIVIGGAASAVIVPALQAALVGLAQPSAAAFVLVPAVLVLVMLLSCYVPARRASRVDPMLALRYE